MFNECGYYASIRNLSRHNRTISGSHIGRTLISAPNLTRQC